MKKHLRYISLLLIALLILSLCGCKGEEYDANVYADIGSRVTTLDPQLVSSASERTIVLNLFSGLMALDKDGNAVTAAAESYTKKGNTYTFKLRDDLLWNDGSALTARDFAFGLYRAADDSTAAPDFDSISSISGAYEVHSGKTETLSGVKVIDERTLEITLSRADDDFLKSLSKPVSMPCNEDFFKNTKGKYGRDKQSLLSNGAFYLHSWDSYNYLVRIKRNEHYFGEEAIPFSVYFTSDSEEERLSLLKKNSLDIAFVPCDQTEALKASGLKADKYYNRAWFIFINKDSAVGTDDVRRAFQYSIHRAKLENEFPSYVKPLYVAMPLTAKKDGENVYDKIKGANRLSYNPDEAYRLYSSVSEALSKKEPPVIIYPADSKLQSVAMGLAADWQQTLGCYVNMTDYAANSGVISTVKNGYYSIAIASIDANSSDPYEFLCNFKSGNAYGFASGEFDRLVDSLPSKSGDDYINTVIAAEQILLNDSSVIPLCITSTDVAYSDSLSNVEYCIDGGYINFAKIVKK